MKYSVEATNKYDTLLPLTDEAVIFHLAGSGSPHAAVFLWVSVNHHHTVSLRGDSELRTEHMENKTMALC